MRNSSSKHPFGLIRSETRKALIEVAMGRRAPTRIFRGARIFNVYSGELLPGDLAVFGDRIACVAPSEALLQGDADIVDVSGRILAPGYLEIHSHPFYLHSPATLAVEAARRGTTTVIADALAALILLGKEARRLLDENVGAPIRMLWGMRTAPQTVFPDPIHPIRAAFDMDERDLCEFLEHPRVVQIMEWSDWGETVRRGRPLPSILEAALSAGMPVDVHAPGASSRTLAALAAAGAGDCHESLRKEDVLERLRQGFYVPLRHSGLRPDLPELIRAIRATPFGVERLMLTTDGPSPTVLADGFMDRVLQVAIDSGLEPALAHRMVTLHPAVYLGLEREVGSLAPGRLADILVLEDLEEPTPQRVYIGGEPSETLSVWQDWNRVGVGPLNALPELAPESLLLRPETVGLGEAALREGEWYEIPVIEQIDAVITRRGSARLPLRGGVFDHRVDASLILAVAIDPVRGNLIYGLVRGWGSPSGIACTLSLSGLPFLAGKEPTAMAAAYQRVRLEGGGICLADEGGVLWEAELVPLELGGLMSDLPVPEMAKRILALKTRLQERGYPWQEPTHTFLFFTADILPGLRLTPIGLWDVKSRQVLTPPVPIPNLGGPN